ncbi:hypothetical protein [Clostridium intestinale]|uniref:hypothetical protein n=1 Tax=Clostridium intestinale TaxID=36845 RepID=UPI002DD61D10|nr:hypothetical protein [Clostridium intestinale]WRY53390.1 hypothetical protein P8F83_09315 [Clostridium intestinale]
MKKKIASSKKSLSRQDLANPFRNMSYHERMIQAKVVDIRNNSTVEELGNGYQRIKVIDECKFVR